jgi:glycosyltransferase involved in cell wall biosynthesis
MKVSVALCTYNGQKYLADQLSSIINQIHPVDEIIICDDCSTDKTIKIVQSFDQMHPGIIKLHINANNIGAKKNFEKAFNLTTGDIIFFSDQDDIWEINKVLIMIEALDASPDCLGVFSDAYLINGVGERCNYSFLDTLSFTDSERKGIDRKDICRYILRYGNIVAGSMLAVKKECKNKVLPFRLMELMWHDEWIALALSLEFKLAYKDSKLINYRQHSEQQIGAGNEKSIAVRRNIKMFRDVDYQIKYPLQYFNYIWHTYYRIFPYTKELDMLQLLVAECREDALKAKRILLLHHNFFARKAKLCKWYIKGQFETSLEELLVL